MNYTISTKAQRFVVRARDYQHAAEIACRRFNGRKRGLVANRTTGDANKSGWFQGYYPDAKVNSLNSCGPSFHVM